MKDKDILSNLTIKEVYAKMKESLIVRLYVYFYFLLSIFAAVLIFIVLSSKTNISMFYIILGSLAPIILGIFNFFYTFKSIFIGYFIRGYKRGITVILFIKIIGVIIFIGYKNLIVEYLNITLLILTIIIGLIWIALDFLRMREIK